MRQGNDAIVLFNQVFQYDIVLGFLNSGSARVTESALDFSHFLANNAANTVDIAQDRSVLNDSGIERSQFFFNLLSFQAAKTTERHGNDGLRLFLGKVRILSHGKCFKIERSSRSVVGLLTVKACHQVLFRGGLVLGCANDVNDLVEIINR